MHIIMINSSRPRGNTAELLNKIKIEIEKKNHQVTYLNLRDYSIKVCVGCERCILTNNCCLNDDVDQLMNLLKEADGIIMSSPVFMGQVTGLLKVFIDRTCKWFHRPELVGKPCLLASTTAASGLKNTLSYMQNVCEQWGMAPIGKISKKYTDKPYTLTLKELKLIDEFLNFKKEKYQPTYSQLIQYQVQKVLALKVMDIDRAFWMKRGWDKQIYYYPCQINIRKKAASRCFYKMLFSKVKPIKT